MTVKYPEITVQLTGTDGNAYAILGAVKKSLIKAGHGDEAKLFLEEAMSGDYNHLLQTCHEWITVT